MPSYLTRHNMEGLDYLRLCDELSVIQAALLIAGCDPSPAAAYVEGWAPENKPVGYEAAKTAISNALQRGVITGQLIPLYEHDINGNVCDAIEESIDLSRSRIDVKSLRGWLAGRGLKTGFFFPEERDFGDYLDPRHPRYAPKLAAAVLAWRATENERDQREVPKQALMKWLREHAADFGLTDEDGKPNETGIEEAAKVANLISAGWVTQGYRRHTCNQPVRSWVPGLRVNHAQTGLLASLPLRRSDFW